MYRYATSLFGQHEDMYGKGFRVSLKFYYRYLVEMNRIRFPPILELLCLFCLSPFSDFVLARVPSPLYF
jgi:hypothetical protein